jgi:TolA-binding protein
MKAWARIGTLTACVAMAFGCDQQTEVQRQTHDLQEAQKNVAQVAQELESELERAKADVVRLEQKVALARQGLTDDVLENQKELQEALQAQERRVSDELGQAKREAQIHSRDTEAALRQLSQGPAPAEQPAAVAPAEGMPPEPPPAAPPAPAASDAPREDLVPVRGSDTVTPPEPDPVTPPAPPPAPPQPTSPVSDPTGAVPPAPPPAAIEHEVAPNAPPPVEPAPAQP